MRGRDGGGFGCHPQKELIEQAYRTGEKLGLAREVDDPWAMYRALINLGWIALYQEDTIRTTALTVESIRLCHLLGNREILAVTAVREGDVERSTRLSGADKALWEGLHVTRPSTHHSAATHSEAVADANLPPTVPVHSQS